MAANFSPIYSRIADIQFSSAYITTVSSQPDLATSAAPYLIFTSDTTNGGYVQKLRLRAQAQTTTTATVLRLWINSTASSTAAGAGSLIDEMSLPATTASSNSATANYEIPLNFPMPAGYKLYVTIGASTTNGWQATVFGGKY